MPLQKPAVAVVLDKGRDPRSSLLEGFKMVEIDAPLFERVDEALRNARPAAMSRP